MTHIIIKFCLFFVLALTVSTFDCHASSSEAVKLKKEYNDHKNTLTEWICNTKLQQAVEAADQDMIKLLFNPPMTVPTGWFSKPKPRPNPKPNATGIDVALKWLADGRNYAENKKSQYEKIANLLREFAMSSGSGTIHTFNSFLKDAVAKVDKAQVALIVKQSKTAKFEPTENKQQLYEQGIRFSVDALNALDLANIKNKADIRDIILNLSNYIPSEFKQANNSGKQNAKGNMQTQHPSMKMDVNILVDILKCCIKNGDFLLFRALYSDESWAELKQDKTVNLKAETILLIDDMRRLFDRLTDEKKVDLFLFSWDQSKNEGHLSTSEGAVKKEETTAQQKTVLAAEAESRKKIAAHLFAHMDPKLKAGVALELVLEYEKDPKNEWLLNVLKNEKSALLGDHSLNNVIFRMLINTIAAEKDEDLPKPLRAQSEQFGVAAKEILFRKIFNFMKEKEIKADQPELKDQLVRVAMEKTGNPATAIFFETLKDSPFFGQDEKSIKKLFKDMATSVEPKDDAGFKTFLTLPIIDTPVLMRAITKMTMAYTDKSVPKTKEQLMLISNKFGDIVTKLLNDANFKPDQKDINMLLMTSVQFGEFGALNRILDNQKKSIDQAGINDACLASLTKADLALTAIILNNGKAKVSSEIISEIHGVYVNLYENEKPNEETLHQIELQIIAVIKKLLESPKKLSQEMQNRIFDLLCIFTSQNIDDPIKEIITLITPNQAGVNDAFKDNFRSPMRNVNNVQRHGAWYHIGMLLASDQYKQKTSFPDGHAITKVSKASVQKVFDDILGGSKSKGKTLKKMTTIEARVTDEFFKDQLLSLSEKELKAYHDKFEKIEYLEIDEKAVVSACLISAGIDEKEAAPKKVDVSKDPNKKAEVADQKKENQDTFNEKKKNILALLKGKMELRKNSPALVEESSVANTQTHNDTHHTTENTAGENGEHKKNEEAQAADGGVANVTANPDKRYNGASDDSSNEESQSANGGVSTQNDERSGTNSTASKEVKNPNQAYNGATPGHENNMPSSAVSDTKEEPVAGKEVKNANQAYNGATPGHENNMPSSAASDTKEEPVAGKEVKNASQAYNGATPGHENNMPSSAVSDTKEKSVAGSDLDKNANKPYNGLRQSAAAA
jgi:hypothetical protein